jgi:uncharacterized metal-binding protein
MFKNHSHKRALHAATNTAKYMRLDGCPEECPSLI